MMESSLSVALAATEKNIYLKTLSISASITGMSKAGSSLDMLSSNLKI